MYTITGKKGGMIWDAAHNRPLIRFDKGEAHTEDVETARKLLAMGYAVSPELPDVQSPAEDAPSETWTVKQLREYAEHHAIDVESGATKAELLAALQRA